mgnify:CR=1 FL=1
MSSKKIVLRKPSELPQKLVDKHTLTRSLARSIRFSKVPEVVDKPESKEELVAEMLSVIENISNIDNEVNIFSDINDSVASLSNTLASIRDEAEERQKLLDEEERKIFELTGLPSPTSAGIVDFQELESRRESLSEVKVMDSVAPNADTVIVNGLPLSVADVKYAELPGMISPRDNCLPPEIKIEVPAPESVPEVITVEAPPLPIPTLPKEVTVECKLSQIPEPPKPSKPIITKASPIPTVIKSASKPSVAASAVIQKALSKRKELTPGQKSTMAKIEKLKKK